MTSGVWVVVLTFVVFILTILPFLNGKFECLLFLLWGANGWGSDGLGGNLQTHCIKHKNTRFNCTTQ